MPAEMGGRGLEHAVCVYVHDCCRSKPSRSSS